MLRLRRGLARPAAAAVPYAVFGAQPATADGPLLKHPPTASDFLDIFSINKEKPLTKWEQYAKLKGIKKKKKSRMVFDETTKDMYLAEYYPGITIERVVENTGFPIDVSKAVEAAPPTAEELRILREEVDPQKLIL